MISYRKMKIDDMEHIYADPELRRLITVEPKGDKFAIIALEDENIIGGVSGYTEDNNAWIQCVTLKDREDKLLILDGLIRSSIHILELDGIEYLFSGEKNKIYQDIGFEPYAKNSNVSPGPLIDGEIESLTEVLVINLPDFFK